MWANASPPQKFQIVAPSVSGELFCEESRIRFPPLAGICAGNMVPSAIPRTLIMRMRNLLARFQWLEWRAQRFHHDDRLLPEELPTECAMAWSVNMSACAYSARTGIAINRRKNLLRADHREKVTKDLLALAERTRGQEQQRPPMGGGLCCSCQLQLLTKPLIGAKRGTTNSTFTGLPAARCTHLPPKLPPTLRDALAGYKKTGLGPPMARFPLPHPSGAPNGLLLRLCSCPPQQHPPNCEAKDAGNQTIELRLPLPPVGHPRTGRPFLYRRFQHHVERPVYI